MRAAFGATGLIALTAAGSAGQVPLRVPSEPLELPPAPADSVAAPLPIPEPDVTVEPLRPWVVDLHGLYGLTLQRYNRTDGLVPAWGLDLEATDPARIPSLGFDVGSATTRQRTYWSGWIEQRLPGPGASRIRYTHLHRPATFDGWRVPPRENDLAALVFGVDLLDWWREWGWRIDLVGESTDGRLSWELGYLDVDQGSEPNREPFSLFPDDFRDNPAVEEGVLHALAVGLEYDSRNAQSPLLPTPGWSIASAWERGGGFLGGDLDFVRGFVDLRRYTRFGRDTWWDGRFVWLGSLTDRGVPPQRKVSLGGPGSLRGFPAASFVGGEGFQASTEARFPLPVHDRLGLLFLSWHLVGLADVGAVDDYGDLHADVGIGVSGINLFSYLGLFLVQRVTDRDADDAGPRFIVRLRRDF